MEFNQMEFNQTGRPSNSTGLLLQGLLLFLLRTLRMWMKTMMMLMMMELPSQVQASAAKKNQSEQIKQQTRGNNLDAAEHSKRIGCGGSSCRGSLMHWATKLAHLRLHLLLHRGLHLLLASHTASKLPHHLLGRLRGCLGVQAHNVQ